MSLEVQGGDVDWDGSSHLTATSSLEAACFISTNNRRIITPSRITGLGLFCYGVFPQETPETDPIPTFSTGPGIPQDAREYAPQAQTRDFPRCRQQKCLSLGMPNPIHFLPQLFRFYQIAALCGQGSSRQGGTPPLTARGSICFQASRRKEATPSSLPKGNTGLRSTSRAEVSELIK